MVTDYIKRLSNWTNINYESSLYAHHKNYQVFLLGAGSRLQGRVYEWKWSAMAANIQILRACLQGGRVTLASRLTPAGGSEIGFQAKFHR